MIHLSYNLLDQHMLYSFLSKPIQHLLRSGQFCGTRASLSCCGELLLASEEVVWCNSHHDHACFVLSNPIPIHSPHVSLNNLHLYHQTHAGGNSSSYQRSAFSSDLRESELSELSKLSEPSGLSPKLLPDTLLWCRCESS